MRKFTATELKASLGDILSGLREKGAVQISNHGRPIEVIVPARSDIGAEAASQRLAPLAKLYATGKMSWREIREELDIGFEDLLDSLREQGLALPRVVPEIRAEQLEYFRNAVARAKGVKET